MSINLAGIAAKTEQAAAYLGTVKSGAITLANDPNTLAVTWGNYAVQVAIAEGNYAVWARLTRLIEFAATHDMDEDLSSHAKSLLMDILTEGSDDSWSGRGNDVKRARFDGVRSAASAVLDYL